MENICSLSSAATSGAVFIRAFPAAPVRGVPYAFTGYGFLKMIHDIWIERRSQKSGPP